MEQSNGLELATKTPRDVFDDIRLLTFIASTGHYPALKYVNRKLGPFTREQYNAALINAAMTGGSREVFDFLISEGADELEECLVHVATRGELNLVIFFVEKKGVRNTENDKCVDRAAKCAADKNHGGVVMYLIAGGYISKGALSGIKRISSGKKYDEMLSAIRKGEKSGMKSCE